VVLVPLIVIALILAIVALRVERIREKLPFISWFSSWKDGYFGVHSKPESLLEDEEHRATDVHGGAFSVDTPSGLQDDNVDLATAIDRATHGSSVPVASDRSSASLTSATNLIDVQEDPFDPRS